MLEVKTPPGPCLPLARFHLVELSACPCAWELLSAVLMSPCLSQALMSQPSSLTAQKLSALVACTLSWL